MVYGFTLTLEDGARRSERRVIQYEYPLWQAVTTDAVVRTSKGRGEDKQAKTDQETDEAIEKHISDKWLSVSELRSKTGFGADRIVRSLRRMKAVSKRCKSKRTGKYSERFSLQGVAKHGTVEWTG
jgi:hypothetical protein